MKPNNCVTTVFLLTAGMWTAVYAQSSSSEEADVRSRDDQERVAALKRDVPALERLWSEHFTVNAPNNEVVVGRQAVLDTFVHGGVINFASFERQIEFVNVDGNIAVLMGREIVRPLTDAPSAGLKTGQPIERRFTNIWKKESGSWRLYLRHANIIPAAQTKQTEVSPNK